MALPDEQPTAFALMTVVAETESSDPYLKGLALAGVGECYENGHGVERDVARAHHYYEQAAEYDVAEAAFNVGLYHDEKVNTHVRGPVDLEKAARYYERGAQLGDARCLTNLGILYAARRLGSEKVEEGWKLLERASAAGDSIAREAMTALGSLEAARSTRHGGDLTSLLHTRF